MGRDKKGVIRDTLFCPHCGSMKCKRNGTYCFCKNCGKSFKEKDNALPKLLKKESSVIMIKKKVESNGK